MSLRRVLSIAIVGIFLLSVPAGAIDLTLRGEYDVELRTPPASDTLLPTRLQQQNLKLRLLASESGRWSVEFRNVADSSGTPGGTLAFRKLQYNARFVLTPLTVDVWSGYDVGASYVKSDPLKLLVMGSNGYEIWNMQNFASSPAADTVRVGTNLSVADVPVTLHYHQLQSSANRANLEGATEYGVGDDLKIGGLVRLGITDGSPSNPATHQVVGYAKYTVLGDLALGASVGARFGDGISGDNLAYGVSGEKPFAGGAAVVAASYTVRQENFYEPNAIDAGYQSGTNRFRNEGGVDADGTQEGSIIELIAAWKGAANAGRDLRVILHPTSEGELVQLKEPAYMGILRIMEDASPNPQRVIIGRAGAPLAPNLFGVVEARLVSDDDGVAQVGGSVGATSRTQVRGVVRYNLDGLGWNNWFVLGKVDNNSATGGTTDGSRTQLSAEVWYDAGKVQSVLGFSSTSGTDLPDPDNAVRLFFRLKF